MIQSSFESSTALCSVVYGKEQKDFCDEPLKVESFQQLRENFFMGEQLWQMCNIESNYK